MTPEECAETVQAVVTEVGRVIVGQDDLVDQVMLCLLAEGHVLLEGVPGLGKTMLLKTLAESLALPWSRIQFTPDLMPADIVGTQVLHQSATGERMFSVRDAGFADTDPRSRGPNTKKK